MSLGPQAARILASRGDRPVNRSSSVLCSSQPSPEDLMTKWFGLLVLALPVLLVCGQTTAAEDVERSFRISSDPDEKLIYFASHPESTRFGTVFTLYGDGRLVRDRINQGNQEVAESSEAVLEQADIESLIRLAVEAGLMDLTRDALLDSLGGRMPRTANGRTVTLRVRLEEYQGPAQPEAAPLLDHEVRMNTPSYLARSFPEHREIRGLLDLEEALKAYAADTRPAEQE